MAAFSNPYMQFHSIHGTNIRIDPSQTQATRVESFANGVCFSKWPLEPGQIFLVEIEEKELGWCGHLRIGLTAQDPRTLEAVPEYSLPDLVNLSNSWIFAITRNHNKIAKENNEENDFKPKSFFTDAYLQIEEFKVPRDKLVGRSRPGRYSHILDDLYKTNTLPPTARRSRIGVLYITRSDGTGNMHIIINGEDMGPSARGLPTNQPLYAVVDIFASTKSVRIIQVEHGFPSLQTLCRQTIQKHIVHRLAIDWLELPEFLKNFCKYE
ncbi:neuralized-like protein 2 [Latimeria chalumnae]|uniref:Neuralized E3 ubiquitin protein ligase 2 n=1 Tax=Latimeria chalumnae TaxID=7897 RepID=H3BHD5_LATCH|nr:PREDICTED: neuralized-like protein 2 [Latimeria chalumnae]|eukprot:XP_005986772.1 PREDICTED: neuralized-like protein 2 [Latimeria chalumnae]